MPFTVSHVAAVLPLRGRAGLPLAPLVLGSMAPDVWLFLGVPQMRTLAHSALGVVTVDVLVVVVAALAWYHLLRAPVLAMLPGLAARWRAAPADPGPASVRAGRWVAAAVLGAATHVTWDLFTHGGWVVRRVGVLQAQWDGVSVATWLQYASSVAGLLVVAVVAARWWRRTPPDPRHVALDPRSRAALWWAVLVLTVAGAAWRAEGAASGLLRAAAQGRFERWRFRDVLTDLAIGSGVALGLSLLLVAAGWNVRHAWRARAGADGPDGPDGPDGADGPDGGRPQGGAAHPLTRAQP